MSRSRGGWCALLVLCAGLAPLACRESPIASAEEAYMKLLEAAESGDAARLFDALDTPTRWSIESVHAAQRRMRGLIIDGYPPAERARALSRLPAACEEPVEHPRRYFSRLPGLQPTQAAIKQRLFAGRGQPVGSVRVRLGTADVWREGGSVFRFARDEKGGWGYAELRPEWEQAKVRALHDEETVRANVELYRRQPGAADGAP